jgi:hypothetical protein
MTVHVQCNNCGAWGITDNHVFPDGAVLCTSEEGDPEGSPAGSCCAEHESLEHHLEQSELTGDSRCRPVTITVMGGPGGGGGIVALGPEPPVQEATVAVSGTGG